MNAKTAGIFDAYDLLAGRCDVGVTASTVSPSREPFNHMIALALAALLGV
jgi:hypothetical protein